MVVYRNTKTGRTVRLAAPNKAMDRSKRWRRVENETMEPGAGEASPEPFDPGAHTVDEVKKHLAGADADECERVLAAERAGKNRRGLVGD